MALAPKVVDKLRERARRFRELEEQVASPDTPGTQIPKLLQQRGALEGAFRLEQRYSAWEQQRAEARALLEDPAADRELQALAREELESLEQSGARLEAEIKGELVADEDTSRRKVILELRAGTGGDEASLFAGDLYRMYTRFFEAQGWRVEVIEATPTEVGGFKEVILAIEGDSAWRLLRFESGGHRVQRVPETEAQGRIHTSAATVAVLPEAEEVDIVIRPDDLRIDTMRAGGAGGQHVNKTESAVRITHLPTNTVVVCMDEKSQLKNKQRAMRLLRSRIYEAERLRLHNERAEQRKGQVGSGDRSERVRTYNFPQNRLSDHRLGQNYSLEQVVAGKLKPVLEALDNLDRERRIEEL